MHIAFVVGTRPEIIKTCPVFRAASEAGWRAHLIHTGQHYDHELSARFFTDLRLPAPDLFLGVGSGSHAVQTGEALIRLENALLRQAPDVVMVQGDTNSAVAGALAAIKLRIPVAHLEAGVRSYDWTMPEEVNRRLVDSIATVCLAPTSRALHNLASEGRGDAAHLVGDTLVEVARPAADQAEVSTVLEELQLRPQGYALMTLHRGENVDSESRLGRILECLEAIDYPLVYPIHPRARKMLDQFGWLERVERRVRLVPPLGYVDFLRLLRSARVVLTDSGGVQQESSILGVPCVTLRYNTEWVETVELGQNQLVGVDPERVVPVVRSIVADEVVRRRMTSSPSPFQPGAARRVVDTLASCRERGWPALLPSDFLRDGLPLGS